MTAPTSTSLVCQISLNYTILILHYYPKCCGNAELYSSIEEKCVSMDSYIQNATTIPDLDPTKSQVDVGFPCSDFNRKLPVESLLCDDSINQALTRNATNPSNGEQYCWDVEKETSSIILITEICYKYADWCFSFSFWLSIGLVIITFFLYVAESELRKTVKDKCFICYLANLTFMLIFLGEGVKFSGSSFFKNLLGVGLSISYDYTFITSFCWLNVMCIDMWRVIRSMSNIPERSFNVYAWYAQGLPFILIILNFIDMVISEEENYEYRSKNGGVFSNPIFLYQFNILAVQQIINIFIFLNLGYIMWNQKRKWSGNEDSARNQRNSQEKNLFSRLLRLYVIMGLEWINFILGLYGIENLLTVVLFFFCILPGYLIFINHVLCDQRVISVWKTKVGY